MWNDALPRNGITNWKVYYAVSNTIGANQTDGWQTWQKPAGCAWIYILMLASGGGGNRPDNGSITTAGRGGGSGGHTRLLIPAFVVPDILYVKTGRGGLGATTAGGLGGNGADSTVSMQPSALPANAIVYQAGAQGVSGGNSGAITPAIACLGLFSTVNGLAGSLGAGTANAAGSNIAQTSSGIQSAGAGGGNGTGGGGAINNNVVFPNIAGGTGSTGGNGNNGFQLGAMWTPGLKSFPLIFSGGSGGGGSSAVNGVAGNGGNASYGGGGGGGGSCTDAGGTSGNGGNGGDGIIFIGAF